MTIKIRKENIMKFWNDKVDNGIDSMFDWDHDGELDRTEKMNELEWMTSSDDDLEDEDYDDEDEFDEDDDFDSDDFDSDDFDDDF